MRIRAAVSGAGGDGERPSDTRIAAIRRMPIIRKATLKSDTDIRDVYFPRSPCCQMIQMGKIIRFCKLLEQEVGQRGCALAHRKPWMRTALNERNTQSGFCQYLCEERATKARADNKDIHLLWQHHQTLTRQQDTTAVLTRCKDQAICNSVHGRAIHHHPARSTRPVPRHIGCPSAALTLADKFILL